MPGSGAGSAPKVGCHRPAQQKPLDGSPERRIVDLAREVLEEALELLDRPVGGGQELLGLEGAGLQALHVVELGDRLAPEALDPAANPDSVAALEPQPDAIGLAEHP